VIMSPVKISTRVWHRLCNIEGLLFLQGSPLQAADLARAGAYSCRQLVLLADNSSVATSTTGDIAHSSVIENDVLVDAGAIFTYQCTRRMNDGADICIEMVYDNNTTFLDPGTKITHSHHRMLPEYAAGMVFTSSLLDTLAVQSFYNPDVINIVRHFITGGDSLMTTVGEYDDAKAAEEGGSKSTPSSRMYCIPVPEGLLSRTYGALFKALSKQFIIPLAIIRGVFKSGSAGGRGNKMRYTYTNPSKDTEIFSCDQVIVLAHAVPKNATREKDFAKDLTRAESAVKKDDNFMNFVHSEMAMFEDIQHSLLKLVGGIQRQGDRSLTALKTELDGLISELN
jgi:hypothetical protein